VTTPNGTNPTAKAKAKAKARKIRRLQRLLNRFVKHWLSGLGLLKVNGRMNAATSRRVKLVKYYLGYGPGRDGKVDALFLKRLAHPGDARYFNKRMIRAGAKRRGAHRAGR
jgi:hypothetical protein